MADYAGISMIEVNELCYYDYLLLLRDAVIYRCSQTESGREYLEQCWILEQSAPDRKALRKFAGKE